jgi:hypothetical protein
MVAIEVECWPRNKSIAQLRLAMEDFSHTETTVFLIDPEVYGSAPITRWTLEVDDFCAAKHLFVQADVVRLQ